MPTITYNGQGKLSEPINIGYGRALICHSGKAMTVDAATARAVAAAVSDNADWLISGLPKQARK